MTTTTRTKRPAKKAAAKRAPAKKAAAKRPATKRPAARKTAAKKPAAKVDPRLKARRVQVARVEGRRRLRTLGALIVITILAIGSLALIDSTAFDVDRVVVNGVVETDPATVVATTGIQLGDALLELDLDAAARQVEALPWVATAVAERSWNGDVRIRIVEREAVAALEVENSDLFVLIDASGRQLGGVETRPANFVPIEGVEASGVLAQPAPATARSAVRVVSSLPSGLISQVTAVRVEAGNVNPPDDLIVSAGDDLEASTLETSASPDPAEQDPASPDVAATEPQMLVLTLTNGGRVVLGDDSSLAEKMLGLETMLTRVDTRCLDTIDLRVPSAPALTRRSVEGSLVVKDLATCSSLSTSTEG